MAACALAANARACARSRLLRRRLQAGSYYQRTTVETLYQPSRMVCVALDAQLLSYSAPAAAAGADMRQSGGSARLVRAILHRNTVLTCPPRARSVFSPHDALHRAECSRGDCGGSGACVQRALARVHACSVCYYAKHARARARRAEQARRARAARTHAAAATRLRPRAPWPALRARARLLAARANVLK